MSRQVSDSRKQTGNSVDVVPPDGNGGSDDSIDAIRELRHYRHLADYSRDIILLIAQKDGRILQANAAAVQTYGYRQEELLAMTVTELRAPEARTTLANDLLEASEGGILFQTVHQRKDGSTLSVEVSSRGVILGQRRMIVSVVRDVTARNAQQQKLEQLNRTLTALSKSSQAMMRAQEEKAYLQEICRIIVEDCGHPLVWIGYAEHDENKTVRPVAWAGFTQGYLEGLAVSWSETPLGRGPTGTAIRTGKPCACYSMSTDPQFQPWREQAVQMGYHSSLALPLLHNGKAFGALTLYSHQPDRFSEDETRLLLDLANDLAYGVMTIRTRLAHARAEEVIRLAKESAEAANQAKDHFIAALSHELRTPLTPVLTTARMMETDPGLPPDARESAALIRRNIELEARLIDDLLDLTRISRGKLTVTFLPTNVHRNIAHVVTICGDDLRAKRLQLDLHLDAAAHHILADGSRLQQILWNLLKNAIKFTPDGGHIAIHTDNPAPRHLRVRVTDNGMGIAPDVLPKLFSAFEQGDRNVTRQFGGLGLGLVISKSLADLHGGSLTAFSEGKGRGAVFTLELPAIEDGGKPRGRGCCCRCSGDNIRQEVPTSARILLVEDHADTARVMALLFKRYGLSVETAGSVAAALELLRQGQFDLLISDLGLPDGNGLDLLRQVRTFAQIKAIALSGFGMEEDVRKSREAGFLEHLIKPINTEQLLQTVRRVLSSSPLQGED